MTFKDLRFGGCFDPCKLNVFCINIFFFRFTLISRFFLIDKNFPIRFLSTTIGFHQSPVVILIPRCKAVDIYILSKVCDITSKIENENLKQNIKILVTTCLTTKVSTMTQ